MFQSNKKAEIQDRGMLRHSPRLLTNGYYDPVDPTIRQISYKETLVRIFKRRKPKHRGDRACRNLMSDFNECDFQNLETHGPMLTSETSPQHASLTNRCFPVMRKIVLFALFLTMLGFGVWFCYTSIDSNTRLTHEANSLKQAIVQQKLECEQKIGLMKLMIVEQRLTKEKVEEIIRRALNHYQADRIGMADYALESLGATVIASSETHKTRYCKIFGISIPCGNNGPQTVIQPDVHPGKCWGLKGSQGHLVISLSFPVCITHVTLEHLPKVLSPMGDIKSATRDFSVYGMVHENEEGKHLGKFTYDQDGEPIQTFTLPDSPCEVYRLVRLRILSNWGHPEYTCVYRFRVHSQRFN